MNFIKESKVILIVSCLDLPRPDRPATGGGLRAFSLGEALKERGHQVIYSIPKDCLGDSPDALIDLMYYRHSVTDINEIIAEVRADIVIFSNWGLADAAPECEVPVVVDFNGPLALENLYRGKDAFLKDALTKISALTKLDLVLVGSEAQKTYLIAWCLMAGMDPENFAVEIVPFSLSPDMPKQQPPDEPVFVLAGYDWPWLDGQNAIETVNHELERLKRGHLHIYTSPPPYTNVVRGENSSLDLTGNIDVSHLSRVVQHSAVSFENLTEILCQSSVALDVWSRNLERELAFSSRTVTYLWAGLPVITNNFGELSQLIGRYEAGWNVDPSNNKSLADLVETIVTAPKCLIEPRANARRLVADHLTWDKTIEPLDRFCRTPQINRRSSPLTLTLHHYEKRQHTLQCKLNEAHQSIKVMEKRINEAHQSMKAMEKQIDDLNKIKSDLKIECELMGMVHRRPKGFTVFTSPSLAWLKLRRLLYGFPILFYLVTITSIGQIFHKLWLWRRRE